MISIITPVYNGQRFIESCIRVVIDQKCSAAEHIIVDGGSTDGTVDIIRRFASDYPHIRWISEKDRGQSDAMNKGIAIAQGDIIGFLNVDDFYEPNVLNRVAGIFETLPTPSLLVGNCNIWDDDGNLYDVNRPTRLELSDLLLGPGIYPFPCNPSAYFYHKALHGVVGGFDIDDHFTMDLDFLLRAVQQAHAQHMDETWGNFRFIKGTKTMRNIEKGKSDAYVGRLMTRYRQNLPWRQRCQLALGYRCFSTGLMTSLLYFARRPNEFPRRLRARISQAVAAIGTART